MKRLIINLFVFVGLMFLFNINTSAYSETLKSGIEIDKSKKVIFIECADDDDSQNIEKGMNFSDANFFQRSNKINDLRGDGIVYYKFANLSVFGTKHYIGSDNRYFRLNKDYKVISQGIIKCTNKKNVFELSEGNRKFLWKVSTSSQILDIKSKVYDYKGYRRYQFVKASSDDENKIFVSMKKYEDNQYAKVDTNEGSSLKSGFEINKKEKVKYVKGNNTAYWDFMQLKMNDLRGDGVVYYLFDVDKYYRVNKNYKVVSKGSYKVIRDNKTDVYQLTSEDNQKFLFKISLSSQITDIKSKFYDYSGYRRYEFVLAETDEQEQIRSAIKNFEENKYVKVESNQDDLLKSGIEINKDEKVKYSEFGGQQGYDLGYFYLRAHKINDLRGNGVVYYKFEETTGNAGKYYRLNKDHKVISRGFFEYKKNKKAFELTEDNQKFLWKVSMSSEIVDIKSKVYDYKGYRRYQFVEASANTQNKIYSSIKDFEDGKYMKVEEKQNDTITVSLKSALDIDKKEKRPKEDYIYSGTFFWNYSFLIDDLRGNGPVYYVFNIDEYHRFDKNFNLLSRGTFKEDKRVFELKEDDLKFQWKISLVDKFVDIKSKFYDYKDFKRYHIKETTKKQKKQVAQSLKNSKQNKYAKYDESDDNLNRLWKLILKDKDIEKKYLKYSKKKAKFKGKPIKGMGLAVFIDYKKELSILTKDIYTKEISSPIAWGWEYSHEDPAKIKGFNTDKTVFVGFEAIRNCYKNVRKKKLSLRDGECLLVDVRRITGGGQYPVIWYNYLIEAKKNRILLAKESEKSKQQIADEKKRKKEDEKKKQELLLAQKKAEEDRKKQELLLAQQKKEEEKRKKELLLAQKEEDEKKKQELLLAQKKAEEERKKQELLLAQKKAEEEKKKQELLLAEEKAKEEKKKEELIAQLKEQEKKKLSELELAKKEAEKEFEKKKKELNVDKDSPEIIVAEAITVTSQAYKLKGTVKDKSDFFLEVDGQPIKVNKEGEFLFEGFIINTNEVEELTIVAVDRWNNSTEKSVKINVELKEMKVAKGYEKLLPNKISVKKDKNKIAIIIGVEKYEYLTNLDAAFANRDANAFREYAVRALGVDPSNINLLVDKDASRPKILKALKLWLPKIGGENMDIYLFFAGHGLASDDGKNLYILPQDGDASLLEDTAITRNEIIKILQKTNPKSVTMFFDTCYSGQTRNEETLVASLRPVRIVADDQEIPNNFTIFTASANDQTSGSIEEAKHGMFSYYLMKGMEGAADENKDNKISNGELIAYIQNNVSKVAFSQNREQDPSMSGDKDKILFTYK